MRRLRLSTRVVGRLLSTGTVLLFAGLAASPALAALPRSNVDRLDESAAKQIHVMYVLPSDGTDRALDTNGTLANSVGSFETWLAGKTGGRELRLDRFLGELDITFFRLAETDAQMEANGAFVRDRIEDELHGAGFNDANKVYAVYYDGRSNFACGGGAYPPTLPGNVAAMYLNGLPTGPVPCSTNPFAGPGQPPTYLEFAMLHEILHTLGFVPACAPHQHRAGHVSDNANDLMWAGDGFWVPGGWDAVLLDDGNDDYFGAGIPGCLDLSTSDFLTSAETDVTAPTLSLPGTLTVNATFPGGAFVMFVATASDDTDPSPAVNCSPSSGSIFAIGTTTVTCTATDHAGNTGTGTFNVRVKGAPEQVVDLANKLRAMLNKPALSAPLRDLLQNATAWLVQRKPAAACVALTAFVVKVRLTSSSVLSTAQKNELIADARRIKQVIGC
jgi:HYR domain-containing protein